MKFCLRKGSVVFHATALSTIVSGQGKINDKVTGTFTVFGVTNHFKYFYDYVFYNFQ